MNRNVKLDIRPDGWDITVTIGEQTQTYKWENGPTQAKEIKRTGEPFPEEIQDKVDYILGQFFAFDTSQTLGEIE